jgi:hypothetical protein
MKGYARGGMIPADKAMELFAADTGCAIPFGFAEKLAELANQGYRAKAREVAAVDFDGAAERVNGRGYVDAVLRFFAALLPSDCLAKIIHRHSDDDCNNY